MMPFVAATDPGDLVARSPVMQRIVDLARRAAGTEATVLVTGETGTGKERLARFIHRHSPRRSGPFVAINCGALPDTLLESELFGHVKGAFTGATTDNEGLLLSAAGGTVFLDEIGETSPALQVRLLRAVQERVVRPVGATDDRPIDVRIVAATNRDLAAMVAAGTFRKDLYYRLRVIAIEMPPLRERKEDILPLARQFIERTCRENRCGPCSLSSEVLDALLAYPWPGNVRELENAIERAVVLAEGQPRVGLGDLPPEVRAATAASTPARGGVLAEERLGIAAGDLPAGGPDATSPFGPQGEILPLAEVERRHILAVLERLGGNRKATARALGIGENTLWRRLKTYGRVRPRSAGRRTEGAGT